MSDKNLITIIGQRKLPEAFNREQLAYLPATTGQWSTTEFNALTLLWKTLTAWGAATPMPNGFIRTIDRSSNADFFENVTLDVATLLCRPRSSDGKVFCDFQNFPVWLDVADLEQEVPEGMPSRIIYDENDEPAIVKWKDWKYKSYHWHDFDGRNLIGSFNRSANETFSKYMELEAAGHFTLVSKPEFDALKPVIEEE